MLCAEWTEYQAHYIIELFVYLQIDKMNKELPVRKQVMLNDSQQHKSPNTNSGSEYSYPGIFFSFQKYVFLCPNIVHISLFTLWAHIPSPFQTKVQNWHLDGGDAF